MFNSISFSRLTIVALALLAGALVSQTMHAAKRPYIVMIISDDQARMD